VLSVMFFPQNLLSIMFFSPECAANHVFSHISSCQLCLFRRMCCQ
jgi:hypothetical protein